MRSVAQTGLWERRLFVREFRLLLEGLELETVDSWISLQRQLTYVENSLNYPDSA